MNLFKNHNRFSPHIWLNKVSMKLFISRSRLRIFNSIGYVLFFFLFFSTPLLRAQTVNNYLLEKISPTSTNTSAGTLTFQWIASNNTSKAGNFFILENLPGHFVIQTVVSESVPSSVPPLNPALPLAGPASLTLGPFLISANSSVTFQVTGMI